MFTNRFSPIRSPYKCLLRKTHVQVIYTSTMHLGIVHLKIISFPKTSLTPVDPALGVFPRLWRLLAHPKIQLRVLDGEHRGMTRIPIRTRPGAAGRPRWPIERWSWPRRGWDWWRSHSIDLPVVPDYLLYMVYIYVIYNIYIYIIQYIYILYNIYVKIGVYHPCYMEIVTSPLVRIQSWTHQ